MIDKALKGTIENQSVPSRLSITIDGNLEFVTLSVQLYSYVDTRVNSFMCPKFFFNKSDNKVRFLRWNKCNFVFFIFWFFAFWFYRGKQVHKGEKMFLVIFDTCDIIYDRFISLLPPIVLDNLFGQCNLCMEGH